MTLVNKFVADMSEALKTAVTFRAIAAVKEAFLSKKGTLHTQYEEIAKVPKEQRAAEAEKFRTVRSTLEGMITQRRKDLLTEKMGKVDMGGEDTAVFFRYIRRSGWTDDGEGGETPLILSGGGMIFWFHLQPEKEVLYFSAAVCSEKDNFCRMDGKERCVDRFLEGKVYRVENLFPGLPMVNQVYEGLVTLSNGGADPKGRYPIITNPKNDNGPAEFGGDTFLHNVAVEILACDVLEQVLPR